MVAWWCLLVSVNNFYNIICYHVCATSCGLSYQKLKIIYPLNIRTESYYKLRTILPIEFQTSNPINHDHTIDKSVATKAKK